MDLRIDQTAAHGSSLEEAKLRRSPLGRSVPYWRASYQDRTPGAADLAIAPIDEFHKPDVAEEVGLPALLGNERAFAREGARGAGVVTRGAIRQEIGEVEELAAGE
jgi:hypothetical protein